MFVSARSYPSSRRRAHRSVAALALSAIAFSPLACSVVTGLSSYDESIVDAEALDSTHETSSDAPDVTSVDATFDVAPDATFDATFDVAPDVEPDGPRDVRDDVHGDGLGDASEAASDAAHDGRGDEGTLDTPDAEVGACGATVCEAGTVCCAIPSCEGVCVDDCRVGDAASCPAVTYFCNQATGVCTPLL